MLACAPPATCTTYSNPVPCASVALDQDETLVGAFGPRVRSVYAQIACQLQREICVEVSKGDRRAIMITGPRAGMPLDEWDLKEVAAHLVSGLT
jgi:hypothetical protein